MDAIQNLFETSNVPLAKQFDWDFWRDMSRQLPATHPTLIREKGILPSEKEIKVPGALSEVRKRYGSVLDRLVSEIRLRNYSIRTEQAYLGWTCRYLLTIGDKDIEHTGGTDVASFLRDLALRRNASPSTRNQALNALVFLYDQALKQPLGDIGDLPKAKRPRRLPVVLSKGEVSRLLEGLEGTYRLMAWLL